MLVVLFICFKDKKHLGQLEVQSNIAKTSLKNQSWIFSVLDGWKDSFLDGRQGPLQLSEESLSSTWFD